MKKIISILLLLFCQACVGSSLSRSLGLDIRAPDEFLVLSYPALILPEHLVLPVPLKDNDDFSSITTNNYDNKKYSRGENILLQKSSK